MGTFIFQLHRKVLNTTAGTCFETEATDPSPKWESTFGLSLLIRSLQSTAVPPNTHRNSKITIGCGDGTSSISLTNFGKDLSTLVMSMIAFKTSMKSQHPRRASLPLPLVQVIGLTLQVASRDQTPLRARYRLARQAGKA